MQTTVLCFVILSSLHTIAGHSCPAGTDLGDNYNYKNVSSVNCGCDNPSLCFRKCCRPGFRITRGFCVKDNSSDLTFPVYRDKTVFVRNVTVNKYMAGVMDCNFFLFKNANGESLYVQENNHLWTSSNKSYDYRYFCLDYYTVYGKSGFGALICFQKDVQKAIYKIGMLISIPFLFLTLLVHCILPEKNLHMKALMCYVTNLMLSYIMLVTIELSEGFSTGVCTFLGFTCLFCFISSIFWINVICIDIWLTFSGKLGVHGSRNEGRRVLFYSAYAVLAPVILILITFLINQYGDSTKDYHPGIGGGQCFLKTKWPYLYYFHLPMGILLTVNITLFTLTAIKIRQAKRETKVLKRDDNRTTSENSKNIFRFNLYLKLLFAMGVNWSLETISWALETFATVPKEIFYVTDFCNAIYGLLIFLIFVCKKRTWKILKKRYYQFLGRSHLAHSMSTTNQSTRITSVSISDAPTNGEMRNAESIRLSKRAN
ncbi:probable G-protein coupled receptor Mth-like 10 isoform X2 [Aethina tumida]|uniref:probable G-protein coupled receptor Mth-like 10 isoform X2 n=1 Tax=Aethina tumida TaxID=116153 RepID=UPI00096ADE06|nr:probable G-protein coupled receptor Mth-like 10 isoform X2 [Aethina tumida]